MAVKQADLIQLGRRIRGARTKLGLSQEDVADPAYTAAFISHIEKGKRRASQEALTHIATKLGMTLEQLLSGRDPDEDLRMELDVQRGISLIHRGKAQEALELLGEVLEQARSVGHIRIADLAETALAKAQYRRGEVQEALATYERVLARVADAPPERRTSAVAGKARCLFHLNEVRESVFVLESHLTELEKSPDPDPGSLVETYAALIPAYFESGMVERAVDVTTRGWKLAPSVADPDQRACLYINRAQLLQLRGDRREALASLALAEDLFRHLDWYAQAVKVSLARSFVLTENGQYEEAEAILRDALRDAADTVDRGEQIRALTRLALVRRKLEDPTEGLALAKKALRLGGSHFAGSAADARRELGLCHLALGDTSAAITAWRRSLKDFRALGDHQEVAATAKLLGKHLAETGNLRGALKVYEEGLGSVQALH